jgi:hypothetical protein
MSTVTGENILALQKMLFFSFNSLIYLSICIILLLRQFLFGLYPLFASFLVSL